jgi:hypothetical protein
MPTPREKVLKFVEELVDLHLTNLRICITSRPEADITNLVRPITFQSNFFARRERTNAGHR